MRIENSYLLERLNTSSSGASIFNHHIFPSRWGWQFNPQFAICPVFQYNTILSNPAFTSPETSENFNADFPFSYLINLFTALYVGYDSNAENLELLPVGSGNQIIRTHRGTGVEAGPSLVQAWLLCELRPLEGKAKVMGK